MVYVEVPVASVKRQKWDTIAKLWSMAMPMLEHRTWSN